MNKTLNLLVCVTDQISCRRLIEGGAAIRADGQGDFHVLHVVKTGSNFLDTEKQGEALEYLYSLAKSFGAGMTVLKSEDVIEAIVDFAVQNSISDVVIGRSQSDKSGEMFGEKLKKRLKTVKIHVLA